jgi:hypothetical protein
LALSAAPEYLGYTANPFVNNGEVQNKGWEFSLTYRQMEGEIKYSASLNASYVKNEVISYGLNDKTFKDGMSFPVVGPVTRYQAGYPVWYFRGYKALGIFQDTAEINHYTFTGADLKTKKIQAGAIPGDVKFQDTNGDGRISADDQVMIGKPQPDWTFGCNLTCEYKGIDLNAFFQGVTGNQIFNAAIRTDRVFNRPEYYYTERWTGPGTSSTFPRATLVSTNVIDNFVWSSLNISNGDYLRLKNLTLGYTLPSAITGKIGISKLRFYGTATNLLTFTKYKGTDPEVGMNDPTVAGPGEVSAQLQNSTFGIDRGLYPQPRTYTLGVNVTF